MADSRHTEQPFSLRKLLGLPDSAPGARVRAEATRLLEHIESRLGGAKDEGFAAARRLEIRHLRGFLATELARRTRSPRSHWGALIAGFLLGGASVAGWVLIAQDPPPPAPQAATDLPGELSVLADPPNSTWSLFDLGDQHVLGEHPADGSAWPFPAGRYGLRVRNPSCPDEWAQEIDLPAGQPRRYAPELCRGRGEVVIESSPEGARVQIDGIDRGGAGPDAHLLRTGPHRVRVEKPGFTPWEGQVEVRPDERLVIQAELPPAEGESAEQPQTAQANASPPPPPMQPSAALAQATEEKATQGPRARTGKGGSKSWHDAVKHQLVSDYDRNGSQSLDQPAEILSIPCPVLQNVEASYETGGLAVDMIHLYGFDGSAAPTNTLGVTSSMRGYAYERMKACGLRTRH